MTDRALLSSLSFGIYLCSFNCFSFGGDVHFLLFACLFLS